MKEKITEDIKQIFQQGKNWVKLEVEYTKLTLAEKFTVLLATLVIGAICLLLGIVVLTLLALALVELFKDFMNPALAFLSVAGIVILLIVVIFLCRKPMLLNPIARFITKLIIDK